MKFLQNKIIIGAVCIVVAGVFAFGVLPSMYKGKGGTEKIIKVNATVTAGTKIEETMLVETEVGSFGLPESVVRNKDDIIGKYARAEITADDLIVKSKISDFAANEKLDGIKANGQKLITVTLPQVKQMIERQKEKYGWEFLFLGANIDAVSTAAGFGISADRAVTYEADSVGTRMNFDAVSTVIGCARNCAPIAGNWKENIERHRAKKKK